METKDYLCNTKKLYMEAKSRFKVKLSNEAQESPQKQDGNTYNVSVTASGRKLLNIILEEGELQRSRNGGKNPFKLGEEW